ncbi:Abhydrolase domain-containing protein [Ceratobasidium sp. AG-Ba]|nr:Abhydrolase domain-containing protein [Ceratobasidium sp. AG-Ba]
MAFALDPALPKDLLSHLVVVDISPAVGPISPEFRNYIHAMHEINAAKVQTKKQAEEILKKIEPVSGVTMSNSRFLDLQSFSYQDPSVRAFLLHNLVAPSKGEPLQFRIPLSIIENGIDGIGDFPHTPGKEKWDGPTLFVKGAKSKYINRRNTPVMEQYFPNMRLEVLDAGHWVHAEKPQEFVDLVSKFVSQKQSNDIYDRQ